MKTEMTVQKLRSILRYDPVTGEFIWIVNCRNRRAGSVAGSTYPWCGATRNMAYRMIKIDGRKYFAHRLAFLYMTGRCPRIIDHKDRNGLNNAWVNLREATGAQNNANRRVPPKGIERCGNRWRARLTKNGIRVSLGIYDSKEEAHAVYLKAAKQHYGEFAENWNV